MAGAVEVPPDWYRSGFPPITAAMPWADRTEAEVDRAMMMLRPAGDERVLDLACGIGRHSLELRRRGFEVVGVDISADLLEMAEREAAAQSLEIDFGYFETEAENRRTFEVIAQALREGGGHLMQLPNVLHAEAHLPQKSWIVGASTLELSDHHWNAENRYIEGSTVPIRFGEVFEEYVEIPFRQRLYTVDELDEIYTSVGIRLANTFAGSGKPRKPKPSQFEIFVEGRK